MKNLSLPRWLYRLLTVLPCLPFCLLLAQGLLNQLGPDPGRALVHGLGLWALRLLLVTLAITPLQRFTPVQWLPLRRTVGLYTLAYASLHVIGFAFFYLGLDVSLLARELVKRPYIVLGTIAFSLLVLMGITSTRSWQRRLGRRWKQLHRSIYLVAALVLVHFAWQVKAGFGAAPWYALVFILLMLARRR